MIKSLLDRARVILARLRREFAPTWTDVARRRLARPAPHLGASLQYARELQQLGHQPGWLSPEEQASAKRVAAFDRQTDAYVQRMRRAERAASAELQRIWLRTCATLHLDPIDIEWAILASGELITV